MPLGVYFYIGEVVKVFKYFCKSLLIIFFSLFQISCNDNPVSEEKHNTIFGIWNRVEPNLNSYNHRAGPSGITTLELYVDSTYKAIFDTIKTTYGRFKVTEEIILLFSTDSIYVLRLFDKDDILNNVSFWIMSLNQDSLSLHRNATDSVNEIFIRSSYFE